MLEPGDRAPAFTLPDADARPVSLDDFAGRDVILYFYPKDDTPGCTKEACGFRDAWDDLRDLGAVVLGVSAGVFDGPEASAGLPPTLQAPAETFEPEPSLGPEPSVDDVEPTLEPEPGDSGPSFEPVPTS